MTQPWTLRLLAVAMTSLTLTHVIAVMSASPRHHTTHHNQHRPGRYPETDVLPDEWSPKPSSSLNGRTEILTTRRGTDCPSNHYYNVEEEACRPCSLCPINQIIRRVCSGRRDTWCGPFFEFDKFHQIPAETDRPAEGERSEKRHHKKGHHHKGSHHRRHHDSENEAEPDLTSMDLSEVRSQWRTLSIALIIVLCFVCCLLIFVGLYVFVECRQLRQRKQYYREPEFLAPRYPDPDPDAEPRYVAFFTSRDQFKTSRHLPVYQQIHTGGDVSRSPPVTSPDEM